MTKVKILYGSYEEALEDDINKWIADHAGAMVQDVKFSVNDRGMYAMIVYKVFM